jgi:protein-tyrosine-phosphatase
MKAQKVIIVCKYNQARSIRAAAALRRFFPELEIISSGIQANPSLPIPSSIFQILDQWDLTQYDQSSTPTRNLASLTDTDLVLCADAEIKAILIKQLGIHEPNSLTIHTLEEFANSPLEIPIDPVDMGEGDLKTQLARSIVLSVRAVRVKLQVENLITESRFPNDKAEHIRAQQQMIADIQSNQGVIIDAGFSIPNQLLWQPHGTVFIPFNPAKIEIVEQTRPKSGILISRFEVDFVPKVLLSERYMRWLQGVAMNQKIYVLAQPAEVIPNGRRHEAILALLHS